MPAGTRARGECVPARTPRRRLARATASATVPATPSPVRATVRRTGTARSCAEPAGINPDPVGGGLVGEVEGDDDGEAQVAAGDDEGQVAGDVAGVGDDEDRIRRGRQQRRPERRAGNRVVGERSRAGQVDEERPAGPRADLADLASDRRAGGVRRLGEAAAGPGQERRLADVRPPDEGDDGEAGAVGAGRAAPGATAGPAGRRCRSVTAARRLHQDPRGHAAGDGDAGAAEAHDDGAAEREARASTSRASPRWSPSAASRSASSGGTATTRLRAPTARSARGIGGDASMPPIPAGRDACVSAQWPAPT